MNAWADCGSFASHACSLAYTSIFGEHGMAWITGGGQLTPVPPPPTEPPPDGGAGGCIGGCAGGVGIGTNPPSVTIGVLAGTPQLPNAFGNTVGSHESHVPSL